MTGIIVDNFAGEGGMTDGAGRTLEDRVAGWRWEVLARELQEKTRAAARAAGNRQQRRAAAAGRKKGETA